MASNLFIFAIAAIILLPSAAMATEYIVGGDKGWTINVNYTAWASDKVFCVGDVLVFKYNPQYHNVYEVDAEGFKSCNATGTPLTTGNDLIRLATLGKKWFICGFPYHCPVFNQKLVINVMSSAPAPAPAPAPAWNWYW